MKKMIDFVKTIPSVLRMLIGLVFGILLAIILPKCGWIGIFGTVFIAALKAIAPILVFFLVCSSLSKAKSGIGKRFTTVIVLYMLTTFLAAVVAVTSCLLFTPTLTLTEAVDASSPKSLFEIFENILKNLVENPILSISNGNYIGILFWAILFGLGLKKLANESTIQTFSDISDVVSKTVEIIIFFAPLGIMGIVFTSVSTNGIGIFVEYGKLLLVLVGSMLFVAFVINPIIIGFTLRRNPFPLILTCIANSGIIAFFTRSSAANIPNNMKLCEKLGLDKDFYSVSIPLGATINMDGAAITITVMTLAVCNTMNVQVDILTAIFLSVLATLGACGASGVAGGSLLLIPMACGLFGISNDIAMQAVSVGFIIGIVQDSVETALNSSGDAIFTATAEYLARKKAGIPMNFLGKKEENA